MGSGQGAAPDTEINAEVAAEEERFREAQIKKNVEKRESKSRELSAFLRGEGISLDSDILLDSDGTTYVEHVDKDDDGFVQVRLERHMRQGTMQSRLVTVKPGDTITAEMDDRKAGTTRYAEAQAAFKERVAKKRGWCRMKRGKCRINAGEPCGISPRRSAPNASGLMAHSFDNAPIHGTGSLDDGPKTGRFAYLRITCRWTMRDGGDGGV